uniref:Uncharacterized protein n=1 Tax=Trichuris muris TaxID=70415 RepID=A0A5S6QLK1_TRIMR
MVIGSTIQTTWTPILHRGSWRRIAMPTTHRLNRHSISAMDSIETYAASSSNRLSIAYFSTNWAYACTLLVRLERNHSHRQGDGS